MSEIKLPLSKDDLRRFALPENADRELRVGLDGERQVAVLTREATWHGRLSRNLKILLEAGRTHKRQAYMGAKAVVKNALIAVYGE